MKMFRRISALALAVVMICLLSASAFAATSYDWDYHDSCSFGDEYNSGVGVYAEIKQHSTRGIVEISTNDTAGNEISIAHNYRYCPITDPTNIRTRNDSDTQTDVLGSSLDAAIASIFQMIDAEYSFNVTCSTSYGTDYCSFYSGVLTFS